MNEVKNKLEQDLSKLNRFNEELFSKKNDLETDLEYKQRLADQMSKEAYDLRN